MCMNKGSNVMNRLEKITNYLFIDEAQDLSGFDFDILDKILTSNVKIIMVGDSRQNTFNTSNTNNFINKCTLMWHYVNGYFHLFFFLPQKLKTYIYI